MGLALYWLTCGYLVLKLLVNSEWLMFVDVLSLSAVLLPAIAVWFVRRDVSMKVRLTTCLKVSWLSGGLVFTYGLVSMFGHFNVDVQGLAAGLSVALLPIIYCFVLSLFCAPVVFSRSYCLKNS